MAKNVTIGNKTYTGINKIKVKASETETYYEFLVTDDATATATDIVSGKTAYVAEGKVEGTLEEETKTITPDFSSGNVVVTPTSGKVLSQVTIIKDENLIADNIKSSVTIFGQAGGLVEGKPIEVSTATAMNSLLVSGNVGKVYKFTGTTDANYINGELYEVVSE